uniref:Uncharacterized protein n=1 Tax=Desertifilum tharense IPPAS B-1220 TaxID=1781255 RepID=A0ACD5H1H7_9CYAN
MTAFNAHRNLTPANQQPLDDNREMGGWGEEGSWELGVRGWGRRELGVRGWELGKKRVGGWGGGGWGRRELGVGSWGRRGWGDGEVGGWGEEGSWELGVGS